MLSILIAPQSKQESEQTFIFCGFKEVPVKK